MGQAPHGAATVKRTQRGLRGKADTQDLPTGSQLPGALALAELTREWEPHRLCWELLTASLILSLART